MNPTSNLAAGWPTQIRKNGPIDPRRPLRWISAEEVVRIAGFEIHGGMFYMCENQPLEPEPSAIRLNERVDHDPNREVDKLHPHPNYFSLHPRQRSCYLEWLAQGRRDDDPTTRDLGYLFLFLSGIERRVLVDNDHDPNIADTLIELLSDYGFKSDEVRSKISDLLHLWSYRLGPRVYDRIWPHIFECRNQFAHTGQLSLILASLVQINKPASARVARLFLQGRYRPAREYGCLSAEQREVFDELFRAKFADGLPLVADDPPDFFDYDPINQWLSPTYPPGQLTFKIPTAMLRREDRLRLIAIWKDVARIPRQPPSLVLREADFEFTPDKIQKLQAETVDVQTMLREAMMPLRPSGDR